MMISSPHEGAPDAETQHWAISSKSSNTVGYLGRMRWLSNRLESTAGRIALADPSKGLGNCGPHPASVIAFRQFCLDGTCPACLDLAAHALQHGHFPKEKFTSVVCRS